jgi:cytochrome c oxidase subunit 4
MQHEASHKEPKSLAHVDPIKDYLVIWFLLLVLLVITVLVAFKDLGVLSMAVAMGVAVVKAGMVIWVFMGMRHSTRLMQVWASIALIFLFTMFLLALSDYLVPNRMDVGDTWQTPKREQKSVPPAGQSLPNTPGG